MLSFETWLAGKDPDEKYRYGDCHNCACAQYLKHVGKFDPKWLAKANLGDAVYRMNSLAAGSVDWCGDDGHTFGELLSRVRKWGAMAHAV